MAKEKLIHLDIEEVIHAGVAGAALGVTIVSKVNPGMVPAIPGALGLGVGIGAVIATPVIRAIKKCEAEHEAKKP